MAAALLSVGFLRQAGFVGRISRSLGHSDACLQPPHLARTCWLQNRTMAGSKLLRDAKDPETDLGDQAGEAFLGKEFSTLLSILFRLDSDKKEAHFAAAISA